MISAERSGLFSLAGKRALVTGASGGIGGAIARAYAAAGAEVAVHGRRPDGVEHVCREIETAGGKSVGLLGDVSDVACCRRLISDTCEKLGRLDILVNCAGMNRRKPIREMTEDDFDTIVAANLKSVYFLSQAAHGIMKDAGGGKIVNIGSLTSSIGLGGVSIYGATKAALWQLTRTMAVEWAQDNIQVNCLAPGFIVTPLTEQGIFGDPHRKQWILDRVPARRPGTPEDLVGVALLMAAPASDYMTGQLISVDGGFLAGGSWLRDDE